MDEKIVHQDGVVGRQVARGRKRITYVRSFYLLPFPFPLYFSPSTRRPRPSRRWVRIGVSLSSLWRVAKARALMGCFPPLEGQANEICRGLKYNQSCHTVHGIDRVYRQIYTRLYCRYNTGDSNVNERRVCSGNVSAVQPALLSIELVLPAAFIPLAG